MAAPQCRLRGEGERGQHEGMTLNPVKWLHGKTHKKGDRGADERMGWAGRREAGKPA